MRLVTRAKRLGYRVLTGGSLVRRAQVDALRRRDAIGRRGRFDVRVLWLRDLAFGPPTRGHIRVGGATLELGTTGDFGVDWGAFREVFLDELYTAVYAGSTVLDIGGHKGYFGAYALALGATRVDSYEPAAANFETLLRASQAVPLRWNVHNLAVGSTRGSATLQLDRWSWGHSLVEAPHPIGTETVSVVTLDDAVARLPAERARTVVKIDAEGSECEILTAPRSLDAFDLLMVEWHRRARCSEDQLVKMVTSRGLALTARRANVLHFERRHVPY